MRCRSHAAHASRVENLTGMCNAKPEAHQRIVAGAMPAHGTA
jgi:hypothetical protein